MLPAAINVHLYPRECSTNHLYMKPLLTFKSDMREAVKLEGKGDVTGPANGFCRTSQSMLSMANNPGLIAFKEVIKC